MPNLPMGKVKILKMIHSKIEYIHVLSSMVSGFGIAFE